MAADDEFESFRGAIADLDADRQKRIRARFEALRAGPTSPTEATEPRDDDGVLHLVPTTDVAAPRPRHTRAVLIGVAAIVALVALVGAITLFRSSHSTTDVASGVDDVPLREIASRARTRPDVELQGDEVLYQRRLKGDAFPQNGASAPGVIVTTTESWARRDGTGVTRISSQIVSTGPGETVGAGSGDAALRPIASPEAFLAVRAYGEIRSLPTTSAELLNVVRTSFVSGDDPADAVQFLSALLALDITPPDVRAAGFEAIETLGAQPVGRLTTFSGAEGVAYRGVDAAGRPWLVVVDPASTKVLAFVDAAGEGDNTFLGAQRWDEFDEQRVESGLPS